MGATKIALDETSMFGFGNEFGYGWAIEFFSAKLGKIRIAFQDAGQFKDDLTTFTFPSAGEVTVTARTKGMVLKRHVDFSENFRGFFRLGRHAWEREIKAPDEFPSNEEGLHSDSVFGFGGEYKVNDVLAFISGYDNYRVGEIAFEHTYIGLKYSF